MQRLRLNKIPEESPTCENIENPDWRDGENNDMV